MVDTHRSSVSLDENSPSAIPHSTLRMPYVLLALLIILYTVVFTGLNWYRMLALRQGFDFLVYEQPIWNTIHGRPFAQSMYSFSPTHLGVDLAFFELWVAPFYALWQSPMSLFVIISLGAALGAWPLFLIAREQFGSPLAGLAWATLYLLFLPVGTITLAEFQPRLFAASALFGAYWFYRRGRAEYSTRCEQAENWSHSGVSDGGGRKRTLPVIRQGTMR